MKCSDVQRVLPEVIDQGGDAEFQLHLQSCPACSELVADLKLIVSEAHELAESEEPPARVWVGIANQLRAEGIIREPETVPGPPVLVPTPTRRWNAWWLAPVAVAILAVGSYQLTHQHGTAQVAQVAPQPVTQPQAAQQPTTAPAITQPQMGQQVSQSPTSKQGANQQAAQQPPAVRTSPSAHRSVELAQHRTVPPTRPIAENPDIAENTKAGSDISAPPSDEDQRFLSEVSVNAPTMRATYEKQLRAVNTEIRETLAYIRLHPRDQDARQHLMDVYEQKAMLYQMALDRVQ